MTDVGFATSMKAPGAPQQGMGLPMPNMMNIVNHPDRDTFGAPLHHLRFKRDQPGSPFHSTTTVHIPTESHPKTAMEVIEQMSDISGTITTLMRENVQLRTKLLNTKAPFWKKLMVNLQSSRTLFDEWRKAVMLLREERRRAEMEARYFESIGQHQSALASVHMTKDQRIEQLEKELEIAINHTKSLQDELMKRDKDIQRYVKFFYEAQESFNKAANQNLPEDKDEMELGFDLNHPAYKDEERQPDPTMVAELVISKLHDILEAVDGRYVAPLQRGKNMHRRVKDVNELFHGYRMIQEKREALGAGGKKLQPLKFDFNVPKVGIGMASPTGGSPRSRAQASNLPQQQSGIFPGLSPLRVGKRGTGLREPVSGPAGEIPTETVSPLTRMRQAQDDEKRRRMADPFKGSGHLMFAELDPNLHKHLSSHIKAGAGIGMPGSEELEEEYLPGKNASSASAVSKGQGKGQ